MNYPKPIAILHHSSLPAIMVAHAILFLKTSLARALPVGLVDAAPLILTNALQTRVKIMPLAMMQ